MYLNFEICDRIVYILDGDDVKVGIIGIGIIGKIILKSLTLNYDKEEILISNRTIDKILQYEQIATISSNIEIAKECDYIFLCVHPNQIKKVILQTNNYFKKNTVLLSVAAGVKISDISYLVSNEIIRLMPNTPAKIGEGIILYTKNKHEKILIKMLSPCGMLVLFPEELFDQGSVAMGSLPAYVYYLIDIVVNKIKDFGISELDSKKLVSNTIIGATRLYLSGDNKPSELIEQVCSEGGSTFEGLKCLRESNITEIVNASLNACYKKTKELGK